MSNLQVYLNEGILQKSSDFIGSMENYVVLTLTAGGNKRQFRSKIVKGKAKESIKFNETINIPIPPGTKTSARLDITIMDEDMTTDDVCGTGFSNMDHCLMFQPGRQNYEIRLYEKSGNYAGILRFSTTFN